jgi:hypothetical protein
VRHYLRWFELVGRKRTIAPSAAARLLARLRKAPLRPPAYGLSTLRSIASGDDIPKG